MSFFFDLLSLQFIPGPQFLFVYAALVVACGIFLAARSGSLRRRRIQDIPPRPLSAYELAVLRDGPRRALNAAIVHLEANRALTLDSSQTPRLLGHPGYQTQDRLERAILDRTKSGATLGELVGTNSVQEQLADIQADLQARNWLLPPAQIAAVRKQCTELGLLLGAMGLTRLFIGLSNGRPVNYLIGELVLMAATIAWFSGRVPTRAAEAERALQVEVRNRSALSSTASADPGLLRNEDKALAVALFGVAPLIATLMPVPDPVYSPSSWSGGSSYSSSDSSYSSCSSSSTSSCSSSSSSCSSSSSSCGSSSSCSSSSCGSSSSSCGG